jgi:predicted anti-sigma-YlaC factor YlaD
MMKTTHLNADQIDLVLMGGASHGTEMHLAGCEACRTRVAEVSASLTDFRAVAVAWSERKSATMPTSLSAALAHKAGARRPLAWSAATMALFAVGFFTTMMVPGHRVSDAGQIEKNAIVVSGQGSAEELAGDNQMLNEIDRELGTSADAAGALELNEASGEGHGAAGQVED